MEPIGPGPGAHVLSLAADERGRIYAGMGFGEVRVGRGDSDWRTLGEAPAETGVTALVTSPQITIAGAQGAWAWQQGRWRALADGLPDAYRAKALLGDQDGALLLATDTAVYRSSNGIDDWEKLPTSGLPGNSEIYRLGRDLDGALLAGTTGDGLLRLKDDAWRGDSEGLPAGSNIFSIQHYDDGLALGSDEGPFWRADGQTAWEPLGEGMKGRRVIALARTTGGEGGELWAGSDDGVYRFDGAEWSRLEAGDSPDEAVAWLLAVGSDLYAAAGQVYRLQRP